MQRACWFAIGGGLVYLHTRLLIDTIQGIETSGILLFVAVIDLAIVCIYLLLINEVEKAKPELVKYELVNWSIKISPIVVGWSIRSFKFDLSIKIVVIVCVCLCAYLLLKVREK